MESEKRGGAGVAPPAAEFRINSAVSADRFAEVALVLPEKPLVVIEPSKDHVSVDLKGIWAYRDLFYFLTLRDLQVRYKQTVLGVVWAILQPLCMMFIFALFFGRLAGMSSDNVPYPIFAFTGLLGWIFFSNAITNSGNSLVGSSNLLTKVYFPRLIIPAASVAACVVDLGIGLIVLVPLLMYYRIGFHWQLAFLLPIVAMTFLLAFAVGTWMSALNVKYRDVKFALPFLVQLWMFASPVIYPLTTVPKRLRWAFFLNPMAGAIGGFRWCLLGLPVDLSIMISSGLMTFVLLLCGLFFFRRMERSFADIV